MAAPKFTAPAKAKAAERDGCIVRTVRVRARPASVDVQALFDDTMRRYPDTMARLAE